MVTGGEILKAGGNEFPEFGFEASKKQINHALYQKVCNAWQATMRQMVTLKQIWLKKAQVLHGCKQLGANQS